VTNKKNKKRQPKKKKTKKITLAEMEKKRIQMERINNSNKNKYKLKKLLQNQRNSFTYLFQRRIINQEFLVLSMRKLKELKTKFLNSKRKTSKLLLLPRVLCMVKVKAFSIITSKELGFKIQENYLMLERVKI